MLITGALDLIIDPLRPLFDDVVCAKLGESDDRLPVSSFAPPTGEARALLMAEYASSFGLELEESVAYADSASDLPMLEAVGHPVAVNPETKLAAIARKRGWHVEQWPKRPAALARCCPSDHEREGAAGRTLDPRFATARLLSEWRGGAGARLGPLKMADVEWPALPGRTGNESDPASPGSAAATWPPSTDGPPATSNP